MKRYLLVTLLILSVTEVYSQLDPLWIQDTSFVKELYVMKNKFQSLSFTGYLQVQHQWADSAGISSFNGGDFAPASDQRYMIRRGRFRLDYERRTAEGFYRYNFALQFDGTEKGVNIRDMFGRIYENKWNNFVATVGVFNRPFSYELNYSSSLRESPERGRMSQILMKTERDMGAMLSFDPQDRRKKIYPLKIDAGFFNGQGLTGTGEYDSFKDFITRASLKRTKIADNLYLSGGASYLNGGFSNGSDVFFRAEENLSGSYAFIPDTSSKNKGKKSPRIYYGADIQIIWDNALGRTELRGEYMTGTQSSTSSSSVTPPVLPVNKLLQPEAIYIRDFNGAYFYLLQTFFKKHQVFAKYDWYDPNTRIKGEELKPVNNFGAADLRFDTFGTGYIFYLNDNLKFVFYYDHPVNEKSAVKGFSKDLKDDTYTIRVQFRF
ncbi:MAG: porin [Bacteroidetes bacterium]|nr:porin [Bacteroidota bacterium]